MVQHTHMVKRFKMFFILPKYHDQEILYVREVMPSVMHLYTAIQFACWTILLVRGLAFIR